MRPRSGDLGNSTHSNYSIINELLPALRAPRHHSSTTHANPILAIPQPVHSTSPRAPPAKPSPPDRSQPLPSLKRRVFRHFSLQDPREQPALNLQQSPITDPVPK